MLGSYKKHLKNNAEKYLEKLFGFKIPVDDVLTHHEGCGGEHYRIMIGAVKINEEDYKKIYDKIASNSEVILEVESNDRKEIKRIAIYNGKYDYKEENRKDHLIIEKIFE